MKKNIIHEFDCGIYPRTVWVAIGVPDSVIRDMFGNEVASFGENAYAQVDVVTRTKPDIKSGVLIRFENKKQVNFENVAHESTHAALEIFRYIGARIDADNQEPFAYLVGWIAKMCKSCLKNK